MKKEKKSKVTAGAQTVTKPVPPQAVYAVEAERMNTADTNGTTSWTTKDEHGNIVGYNGVIKTTTSLNDVLSDGNTNWVTAVPSNLLTFLSLEYSVEELKKVLEFELPAGLVTKVTLTDNGNLRLFLDKDKLKELPNKEKEKAEGEEVSKYEIGLVSQCYRDMLAKLNLNKFPDSLMGLAADTGFEFKLADGGIIIDITGKRFVSNRILPSIIREESIKGYPLSNIELSDVKVNGDKLFFALTFKNNQVCDSITISNKTLVAARFSMTHGSFGELAKTYLDGVAAGAKIRFADQDSITRALTAEDKAVASRCIETNAHEVLAIPMIDITEATGLYKKADAHKGFKNPMLSLTVSEMDNTVSFHDGSVRKKLAAVLNGEDKVLTYRSNISTTVLPNIKKLVLASVFDGDIPSNLKVSWASDNVGFGFSLSL